MAGTTVANLGVMNRRSTARLASVLGLAWLAPLLSGCVMSPMPEPPQATIDVDGVVTYDPVFGDEPTIVGGPGAASPAGALLRAFNLDADVAPVETLVETDGSFEVELVITAGQEARLQVVAEALDARSAPLDVVIGPHGSTPTPAPRPLAGCLELTPAAELDLADAAAVLVRNRCGAAVQLEQPALRRPVTGLEVGAGLAWPATLADGDELAIDVQAEAGFATEDVFFVEASSPQRDRRPITFVPP